MPQTQRIRRTWLLVSTLLYTSSTWAGDLHTILVAPKGSAAYDQAKQLAKSRANTQAVRKVQKALNLAAQRLTAPACGDCEVQIKIAAGDFTGKARTGHWSFPDVQAPEASLRILGGYQEDFRHRDPFANPSRLVVNRNRSQPVLTFKGRKHALRELMVSGLTVDLGDSNAYDAQSNTLLKGGSSSYGVFAFGYLTTEKLVIADNVLMNAPNGVAAPLIRAMSPQAEVIVFNNFFINNVHTWVVGAGGYKHKPARYLIASNSFVMNWPYNPDATTSNPGAIEIGNQYVAQKVEITRNLFAFNAGGAIHPQYDDDRGPKLAMKDNLFWRNGSLFGVDDPAAGAVVGKFAGAGTHSALTMEDVEDDFTWEVSGNASFDPLLTLSPPKMKAVAYGGPKRGAPDEQAATAAESPVAETSAAGGDAELDALEAELAGLLVEDDRESLTEPMQPSLARDELGEDFASVMGFDDTEASVSNFAPYFRYAPDKLPVAYAAPGVGADPEQVAQY